MNTSTKVQENLSLKDLPDEVWKDVPNYKGIYQASNLGRVKSLDRTIVRKTGSYKISESIRVQSLPQKYYCLRLSKNGFSENIQVHQLIAITFLGHNPDGFKLVVDHKDNNPLNNHVDNLQLITNRQNSSKDKQGHTSKYIGVSWKSSRKKWRASIYHQGSETHLGFFTSQLEASKYYQMALRSIRKGEPIKIKRKTNTSKYEGVYKKGNRWAVQHEGKYKGTLPTEEEAHKFKLTL